MIVGGADLSLRSTGLAKAHTGTGQIITRACRTKLTGHARLDYLMTSVIPFLTEGSHPCDLVVIEGLAYGAQGNSLLDLAGLATMIRHELWRRHVPYALIGPTALKMYATGYGHADKPAMMRAAYQLLPQVTTRTDDEADAVWLAEAGCRHYGHPLCALPDRQAAVLASVHTKGRSLGKPKIVWPLLGAATPVQAALPGLMPDA